MRKIISLILMGFVVTLIIAYLGVSWYFSGLIIHGHRNSIPAIKPDFVATYSLPTPENIQIQSAGITLAGWYFDLSDNPCGVAIFHGHESTRYDVLNFTRLFTSYNCDIVMIDFRNHGESGGDAGTFGAYERFDVVAALDYLQERTGLPDNQLALVGTSYGAASILQAVSQRPNLAFVLADSPYSSLSAIISVQGQAQYGSLVLPLVPGALAVSGLRAGFNPWDVSPEYYASQMAAPVFLIHEERDKYIPSSHSQGIYNRIPHERKILHLVNWSGNHSGALDANYRQYQSYLDEFIDSFAPQFGKP